MTLRKRRDWKGWGGARGWIAERNERWGAQRTGAASLRMRTVENLYLRAPNGPLSTSARSKISTSRAGFIPDLKPERSSCCPSASALRKRAD